MGEIYQRTEIYDLFQTEEYESAIRRHWEVIQKKTGIQSLLDCSIGTGNLTLPAAELGIAVTGSDLSREMLDACRKKAERKGYSISLVQSDFCNLSQAFGQTFDCVGSTGNSLPHVKQEEVFIALEQMDALVNPGGYLYFDMRNWDRILTERERFFLYPPQYQGDVRINLIQVWDYLSDETMEFHLLYTFEKENQMIQKEVFTERYYPIRRQLLLNKLKQMGYRKIEVLCHPAFYENVDLDKAAWYCVLAEKGE